MSEETVIKLQEDDVCLVMKKDGETEIFLNTQKDDSEDAPLNCWFVVGVVLALKRDSENFFNYINDILQKDLEDDLKKDEVDE